MLRSAFLIKSDELRKLVNPVSDISFVDIRGKIQQVQQILRDLGLDPNTLYQELEISFRYVDTHCDASFSNSNIQLQSHTFYELLYVSNNAGAELRPLHTPPLLCRSTLKWEFFDSLKGRSTGCPRSYV